MFYLFHSSTVGLQDKCDALLANRARAAVKALTARHTAYRMAAGDKHGVDVLGAANLAGVVVLLGFFCLALIGLLVVLGRVGLQPVVEELECPWVGLEGLHPASVVWVVAQHFVKELPFVFPDANDSTVVFN